MGRKKLYFTPEERKQAKAEYNKKYKNTTKGRESQKKAMDRYNELNRIRLELEKEERVKKCLAREERQRFLEKFD